MACAIVSGYALDCKDSAGGIVEIYFIEKGNATAINEVLKEDANKKYIQPVISHWLDEEVKQASRKPE